MLSDAIMRYKHHVVKVKMLGNQIFIESPRYLAKVWAKKELRSAAQKYDVELTEFEGRIFISYKQIAIFKKKVIPVLNNCIKK